jgi:molybdopterin-guanine dinucleotide biosynthesis protein A
MDVTVAVLAGGRGSRIGGDKALVQLGGRPLVTYPLQAAHDAGLDAVVVAKSGTRLPPLEVPVLLEPDAPIHPLLGIITALEKLPVVIALPCDMPFVEAAALSALAEMSADVAVLARNQPFPSLYRAVALPQLREALQAGASVRSTQAQSRLAPAWATSPSPASQLTVNTSDDLARAEALLSRR